ncbi:hypothetical protein KR074_000300 [Drosophila pseudoananassae]|nr:hypothetical protein KR074_000300 [Drosophila pseudoananassae]
MNPPEVDKEVADQVRFHLSKEELDRQTRNIQDRGDQGDSKSRASGSGSTGRSHSMTSLPEMPRQDSWVFKSVGGFYVPTEDLSKMSLQKQEQLLIKDLIYAFSGVPSTHIKPDIKVDQIAEISAMDVSKVRFRLDDAFSGALRGMVNELLPLIGYYISVQSFIEETNMTPSCGRTRLALATSFGETMQQYYDLQAKLETDQQDKKLNLKELVRQARPWLGTLKLFSGMAEVARGDVNSAQLLSLLDESIGNQKFTDPELKARVSKTLGDVTRSYMKIVQLWTQKGIIYDPQNEFFVHDNERPNSMSSTLLTPEQCCFDYWHHRYQVLPDRLPDFLLTQGEHIFLAGKYLNILRQCNVTMKLMQQPLRYVPGESNHMDIIKDSYELPAKKLLEILKKEHQLESHLQNLWAYFLMQREGFADALLDCCHEQLQSNVDRLIPEKMQSLLSEVLQQNNDPFKDMLRCQLKACDAATQLSELHEHKETQGEVIENLSLCGYESLVLRYEAKWPLSFVLHSEPLEELQVIQRVLLLLRYVRRQLSALWKAPVEGVGLMKTAQADYLRERMHKCMLNLEHHIVLHVSEPRWKSLMEVVGKAQTIDELTKKFRLTLNEILRLGLLSSTTTYVSSLFTLGQVCLNYCGFVESIPGGSDPVKFQKGVREYEDEFGSFVASILELVGELAKSSGLGGKVAERDSYKELLKRLDEFRTLPKSAS